MRIFLTKLHFLLVLLCTADSSATHAIATHANHYYNMYTVPMPLMQRHALSTPNPAADLEQQYGTAMNGRCLPYNVYMLQLRQEMQCRQTKPGCRFSTKIIQVCLLKPNLHGGLFFCMYSNTGKTPSHATKYLQQRTIEIATPHKGGPAHGTPNININTDYRLREDPKYTEQRQANLPQTQGATARGQTISKQTGSSTCLKHSNPTD